MRALCVACFQSLVFTRRDSRVFTQATAARRIGASTWFELMLGLIDVRFELMAFGKTLNRLSSKIVWGLSHHYILVYTTSKCGQRPSNPATSKCFFENSH